MEKILFPLKYMRETQGVNGNYSHKGTLAIDYGNNGVKEKLYAPFTGTIKKIYAYGNFVWLESNEKVLFADGTVDYATVLTGHSDDVSNLYIGKVIKQGEYYYDQGKSGNATGIHTHLEIGIGKFEGSGWHKNSNDIWMINNAKHPADSFFLTNDINIVDDGDYNFRKLIGVPVLRDTTKKQVEVSVYNLRCRDNPNGNILGFINEGLYNIINEKQLTDYDWLEIDAGKWIAYSNDWAKIYEIESSNSSSSENNIIEDIKNVDLTNYKFKYECDKKDLYAIELYDGEILYIVEKN